MENTTISELFQYYNLPGSLLALALVVIITKVGKWLLFKHPALAETRRLNREQDKAKWAMEKYPPIVRANQKVGTWCNAVFFIVVLPFCITLQSAPLWKTLLNTVVILMVYDFFYYLTHRFWFHGNGAMRQVHAVHHQARNPTYLDAHYVHPKETFVGLVLYMGNFAILSALIGPFDLGTTVVTFLLYIQLNQINHTFVSLPYFPFKTLSWITAKHHIHHENMQRGNYASITLFYDKIFGTLD